MQRGRPTETSCTLACSTITIHGIVQRSRGQSTESRSSSCTLRRNNSSGAQCTAVQGHQQTAISQRSTPNRSLYHRSMIISAPNHIDQNRTSVISAVRVTISSRTADDLKTTPNPLSQYRPWTERCRPVQTLRIQNSSFYVERIFIRCK